MSDINQDEIDKLLQDALAGDNAAAAPAESEEDRGPASQDDIDALFAAVDAGESEAAPTPAANAPDAPEAPALDKDLTGVASQDDIDALFSSFDATGGTAAGDDTADMPGAETATEDAVPTASDSPDADPLADIDALLAAADDDGGPATAMRAPAGSDDLFESRLAEAEAKADAEAEGLDPELDELLSSIADSDFAEDNGGEKAAETQPDAAPEADGMLPGDDDKDETVRVDTVDMDELLRQVNEAAPPPPPSSVTHSILPPVNADTAILDMNSPDISAALAQAEASRDEPAPTAPAAPPPRPSIAPSVPAAAGERREFSVLYGAGEVESVANQISALLSSMSEKAHGYMQSWIAADSEAKELRSRALAEERRRAGLESEKAALARELDDLRGRLGELEGAKTAAEEARRTLAAANDARVRELESRVSLLSSEADSLKDELTRARNEATGIDIESRRVRFELDRLKNEVESERMERLRIQRALENREKEIQAMQSQSAGQASSLFIDELHRLVRRLESELDARTSGAHEALRQLDRLDIPADMVPVAANIRAALMQAVGADADPDDAIKSLGREAEAVRGPQAVLPGKAEMASFETALSTYALSSAIDAAGALLREARATPASLMRKVYQCQALRRPEVADHLSDLARLLEGLRTVQESNDRSRGRESAESETFYVQMFDFLHNLVRLKIINRLTGEAWRIFLDLRGRFSFVTSDKQWAEYRDQILGGKGAL